MNRSTHILLILTVLVWAGCQTQAQPGQPDPETRIPVRTAEVTKETRVIPIRTSGRLASKAEMRLSFKLGGLVDRIFVDEGARVKKGQLLARLDLSESEAHLLQARTVFEKAERDLKRIEALYADSVATLEQLQNAQTAMQTARAGLLINGFNHRHAEIHAPAAGRLLQRLAEANEHVAPGQPVLVLAASTEGWVVRVGLSDRDVVRLRLGDDAALQFDAYPDHVFTGRVTEIAEAADPLSGTFEVEMTVEDPGERLKSGFVARVDLLPSAPEALFFIPPEALVEGDGFQGTVYTVEADSARRVAVRIARILDDEVAIRSGLEDTDEIVLDGAAYLTDGARVEIVRGQ